jgi:hypothetical protein
MPVAMPAPPPLTTAAAVQHEGVAARGACPGDGGNGVVDRDVLGQPDSVGEREDVEGRPH